MSRGEEQARKEHERRLKGLRDKTHKKIDYHLKKQYVDSGEFYHLVKDFFLELLDKKYEATYEDISRDLEELEHDFLSLTPDQRAKARLLLLQLSESEYTGQEIDADRAHNILRSLRELSTELTTLQEKTIDQLLLEGLKLLEEGDVEKARKTYINARKMYDDLGEQEQTSYYTSLQQLFLGVKPEE